MIDQLENQIRDLKKELDEIKKNQAFLRLQPCLGDSEIRKKGEKFNELDGRATAINESVRDLTKNTSCYFPNPLQEQPMICPNQKEVHNAI